MKTFSTLEEAIEQACQNHANFHGDRPTLHADLDVTLCLREFACTDDTTITRFGVAIGHTGEGTHTTFENLSTWQDWFCEEWVEVQDLGEWKSKETVAHERKMQDAYFGSDETDEGQV